VSAAVLSCPLFIYLSLSISICLYLSLSLHFNSLSLAQVPCSLTCAASLCVLPSTLPRRRSCPALAPLLVCAVATQSTCARNGYCICSMLFRDAVQSGFFKLQTARDAYRDACAKLEMVRWCVTRCSV
jgi:hypothetical protein